MNTGDQGEPYILRWRDHEFVRTKKEITLHNVMFPIWFLLVFPITWIVVLPVNFVIDSIVLLVCARMLKLTGVKEIYKRTILKIWIVGFGSDFIGAGILFLSLDSSAGWYEYLRSVAWNPFENWYSLFFVAFAVAAAGVCIYFGNLKFSFNRVETNPQKKRILALTLAVLTAPYILFYPSSLLNGGSWDELRFMTNHIVKMEEFRMEVALNGWEPDFSADPIVMYRYENEMKDAINEADKMDDFTAGNSDPSFTLMFFNRHYTDRKEISVWVEDGQGFFSYENRWYVIEREKMEPFLEGIREIRSIRGKTEFTVITDSESEDREIMLSENESERTDKEGRKISEYPVFEDSRNLYYCPDRNRFDNAMIQFEGREGMDVYTALETGLVSPRDLVDHGFEIVIEERE